MMQAELSRSQFAQETLGSFILLLVAVGWADLYHRAIHCGTFITIGVLYKP
jgi:hypothetical protein